MNDAIPTPTTPAPQAAKAPERRRVAPPVDVFENEDELLLVADVPGVTAAGVELRIESDTLRLVARPSVAAAGPPALAREFEEVDFVATFRLPAGIDAAAVEAETKHGTLRVRLPKAAATRPRQIPVRASVAS